MALVHRRTAPTRYSQSPPTKIRGSPRSCPRLAGRGIPERGLRTLEAGSRVIAGAVCDGPPPACDQRGARATGWSGQQRAESSAAQESARNRTAIDVTGPGTGGRPRPRHPPYLPPIHRSAGRMRYSGHAGSRRYAPYGRAPRLGALVGLPRPGRPLRSVVSRPVTGVVAVVAVGDLRRGRRPRRRGRGGAGRGLAALSAVALGRRRHDLAVLGSRRRVVSHL